MDEDAATDGAPRGDAPPLERLSNPQIAALALYLLGGATARQHQEDVAVKCYELAPRRFGWERHEYPDIDRVGTGLRDAKKPRNGALTTGDKRAGWLLTPEGIDWAAEHGGLASDGVASGASVLGAAEDRELRQLKSHRLFEAWRAGGEAVTVFQAADAVGLPADAPVPSVARRIDELAGAARAGKRQELEGFLGWLKASLATSS